MQMGPFMSTNQKLGVE